MAGIVQGIGGSKEVREAAGGSSDKDTDGKESSKKEWLPHKKMQKSLLKLS